MQEGSQYPGASPGRELMAKRPLSDDLNAPRAEQSIRSIHSSPEPTPDLQEALAVIWHRKWAILAIALLTFGVALFLSGRQTPVYESHVRLLVTPVEGVDADSPSLSPLNLATESELVSSVAVAQIVATNLNIPGPPRDLLDDLSVDNPSETEILEIGYSDEIPRQAQRIAMGFAEAYLQFREDTATRAILESAEAIQSEVAVLTQQLQSMERRLQEMSATDPNRSSLEAQASLVRSSILDRQLAQTGLPTEVTVGRIIEPADQPTSPVSPNHTMNGAFGLVAGLGIGIGLAFLRDRLSERLRSPEGIEAYLEAPLLGAIPRVPAWRRRKEAFLVSAVQWRSPAAEAYRILRTNVLSAASAVDVKSIVVTSAYSGEGKSATAANLGVVLARAGKNVTLVSADLRRPRLHEFFNREEHMGLIDLLAGRTTLRQALQEVSVPTHGFDNSMVSLRLLSSGNVADDPGELLSSTTMAGVLAELEKLSDIVLIDVPPVLPITDALVVAEVTKHVLLVISPEASTRPAITSARQQLDRVGARILGGVLNGPDPSMSQTSYSY
jgi:capsular exopolysaccharide synthesis family protein